MKKISIRLKNSKRTIPVIITTPENTPIGIVQIVHGMCEHKERYLDFMKYLSSKGYVCVCHDLIGHGDAVSSPKEYGVLTKGSDKNLIRDTYLISKYIKRQYSGLNLHLFGHSMGSLIVRRYTAIHDDKISSLIICASPSKIPFLFEGKKLAEIIARIYGYDHKSYLITKFVMGEFNKKFESEHSPYSWICSDRKAVCEHDNCKKCMIQFSVGGYIALFNLMSKVYKKRYWSVKNADLPILFISGEDDPCLISPELFDSAVDFTKKLGYKNVKKHLFSGMRHEILNETKKESVYNTIYDFIKNI